MSNPITLPKLPMLDLSRDNLYGYTADEIERLRAEVAALREDAARLDFLLHKLPGDALRYVLGELSDTSDEAEFRAAIDAARAKGAL